MPSSVSCSTCFWKVLRVPRALEASDGLLGRVRCKERTGLRSAAGGEESYDGSHERKPCAGWRGGRTPIRGLQRARGLAGRLGAAPSSVHKHFRTARCGMCCMAVLCASDHSSGVYGPFLSAFTDEEPSRFVG
jgi:hypothetical protein